MAKYCVVKQGSSIVWTDEVDISKFLPEGVRKGDDGRPIAYHKSGMAPKKGIPFLRLFRDFTISGLNPGFEDWMKR